MKTIIGRLGYYFNIAVLLFFSIRMKRKKKSPNNLLMGFFFLPFEYNIDVSI